jgi:hypothetical protein
MNNEDASNLLVELVFLDGSLNVPIGVARRIPRLGKQLQECEDRCHSNYTWHTIATVDDIDFLMPRPRPNVRIVADMTVREWTDLINYVAYNGAPSETVLASCARNGIPISERAVDFLALHSGALVEKDTSAGGLAALVTNSGIEPIRNTWRCLVHHGATITSTQTHAITELPLAVGNNAYQFRWPVRRDCDGFSWPCVKVLLPALPAGLRWRSDVAKRLLVGVRMDVGGIPFFEITGKANEMLARAAGVWPERANSCERPYLRSGKPWLVAIPIMSNESMPQRTEPFFPLTTTCDRDVVFRVSMEANASVLIEGPLHDDTIAVPNLKIAFEVAGTFLDMPERRNLAMTREYKPYVPQQEDAIQPEVDGGRTAQSLFLSPVTFSQRITSDCFVDVSSARGWVSGFMFRFDRIVEDDDDDDVTTIGSDCPLISATLKIDQFVVHVSDVIDLTELNWMRAGDKLSRTGNTLMLPVGRGCMGSNNDVVLLNDEKTKASIAFVFQPQFRPTDWIVTVTVLRHNVMQSKHNAPEKMFPF